MEVEVDTTDIPWRDSQGLGSSLFQEMSPVMRTPPSQTMLLPVVACGPRDGDFGHAWCFFYLKLAAGRLHVGQNTEFVTILENSD